MIKLIKKNKIISTLQQFFLFGLVGISNTLIYSIIYYIFILFGSHFILANAIGFIISVLNAYILNNRFVFKKSTTINVKIVLKVFIAYGMTFALSTFLLLILISILHISIWLGPLFSLLITIPSNFFLNKYWAFK